MAFDLRGLLAIFGGPASQTLSGTSANEVIHGNGGVDTLNGSGGNDTLFGGNEPDVLDGGTGNDTLVGGAGDDTYVVDAAGDAVFENENDGTDTVRSSVTYVLQPHVENLVLTGSRSNTGTGNDLANTLIGNTGSNVLDGGGGADRMIGGRGNDTYFVNHAGDVVVENVNEGTDKVVSSIDYSLGANIENLTLTARAVSGRGNDLCNTIIGNAENNTLSGGGANDTISGGAGNDLIDGGSGDDSMSGGTDDDTYVVDSTGDRITELTGQGTDQVLSSINFTLGNHVEHLTLTGRAAINGTGNTVANIITGNAADNVLDGKSGADILAGGLGNDTYVVDQAGDVLIETAGEGTDTVHASINFVLGNHFENLTLTGGALVGTGNAVDNVIRGNGQNNTLDGGLGADTLIGGSGNDTYMVDDTDTVVEMPGGGVDTVVSANTYALGANVENLTLTGTFSIHGTGNALGNKIVGNSSDNALSGGDSRDWLYGGGGNDTLDGGTGGDFMYGGAGDDTYIVDESGDTIIESGDSGTDTVVSRIHFVLENHLENLSLTGEANVDATGNSVANVLIGNAGNNRLDGKAGADIMAGGGGDDIYIVDHAGDTVTEYSGGGIDHVMSSVSFTLPDHVENLTFTGTLLANGTGNDLNNTLIGNLRNNVLDGRSGADMMIGGAGNDTYIVDTVADTVVERVDEGIDTVFSNVSYSLSDNVERLTLTGTASINATGNSLANILNGNSANNSLDGKGGADVMTGGDGDDTYTIDDAGDVVIELPGGGVDHVYSSISVNWISGVERITLTGDSAANLAGDAADNPLTENGGANVISGGDGKDTISGGAGNDTLIGDGGDDFLFGNDGHDGLNGGLGRDTLNGGAGDDVMDGGDGNDGLFGGGGQDRLIGGDGDDRLYGDGGHDILRGGAGNDLLFGGQLGAAGSTGNDTFAWMRPDIVDVNGAAAGFDTIADFGIGDRLDFSGLFSSAPPAPLADLMRTTEVEAGTVVSVDVHATGQFFDVVLLSGAHHIDLDDLIGQNAIIV